MHDQGLQQSFIVPINPHQKFIIALSEARHFVALLQSLETGRDAELGWELKFATVRVIL